MAIEITQAFRDAFYDEDLGCDIPGCIDCFDDRLAAVLAIVEREYRMAGPCSSTLDPIVGIVPTWCQLRHGHSGDHESGPTRWKEPS